MRHTPRAKSAWDDGAPFGPEDDRSAWRGWIPALCVSNQPEGCHCERVQNSTLRQQVHAVACVAYVLIGLYAMVDALLPGRDVTVSSTYGALFGFCVIGLGLTECLYHASLTEAAEAAAWQAEVSVLLCLHLFNAECLRWAPSAVSMYRQIYPGIKEVATPLAGFAVIFCALLALQRLDPAIRDPQWSYPLAGIVMFLWLVGVGVGEQWYRQSSGRKRHVRLATALIGAGMAARLYGEGRCDPDSKWQYGALQHVLLAGACAAIYSWIQRWSDDMMLTYERHAD